MTMPQELFIQPLMKQSAPDRNRAAPFHSPPMPPPFYQRNTGGQQASMPSPLSPRSWTFEISVMVAMADEMQKHNAARANLANMYMQYANLHKQNGDLQCQIITLQEALERKEAFLAASRSWHVGKSIRVDTNVGQRNEKRPGHDDTMAVPDATICPETEEDAQGSVAYPQQAEYSGFGML